MEKKFYILKRLFFAGVILSLMSTLHSCIIVEEGEDGKAWVSMDYGDAEPDYVSTEGMLPDRFIWGSKYRAYPGYYTIVHEYEWIDFDGVYVDSYEIEVEIWIEEASDGYDGQDSFFDIVLFSDGAVNIDSYLLKSGKVNEVLKIEEIKKGKFNMKLTHKLKSRTLVEKNIANVVKE